MSLMEPYWPAYASKPCSSHIAEVRVQPPLVFWSLLPQGFIIYKLPTVLDPWFPGGGLEYA